MRFACPACGVEVEHSDLKRGMALAAKHCKPALNQVKRASPAVQLQPREWRLEGLLESENAFLWKHWSVYDKIRRKWQARVEAAMPDAIGAGLAWSSWELERHGGRELDHANLVGGGAKALIDALAKSGVIVDDKPSIFQCSYRQFPGKEKYTILRLVNTCITDQQPLRSS